MLPSILGMMGRGSPQKRVVTDSDMSKLRPTERQRAFEGKGEIGAALELMKAADPERYEALCAKWCDCGLIKFKGGCPRHCKNFVEDEG